MKSTTSNYEKQVLFARELFLSYDQEKMISKFGLENDEHYLYIKMMDDDYRISRKDGKIEQKQGETSYTECMEYYTVMIVYDILCYSKELPMLSGQWCPLASLQVTHSSPSDKLSTGSYAKRFSGCAPQLRKACEMLGGEYCAVPASADVCYQIPFFSFFPIIFQFWDGDDEFEPQIALLWDKNSLNFMHFETLYYAMGYMMQRLEALRREV